MTYFLLTLFLFIGLPLLAFLRTRCQFPNCMRPCEAQWLVKVRLEGHEGEVKVIDMKLCRVHRAVAKLMTKAMDKGLETEGGELVKIN